MALTDSLVAYYKLDGNSNDSVGSVNGTDTYITYNSSYGKIAQGANFNGSLSRIVLSNGLFSAMPFSFSFWVKPDSQVGYIFTNYDTESKGFDVFIAADNKLSLGVNGSAVVITTPSALSTSEFSHVVCVFNGSSSAIYVNGSSVATGTLSTIVAATNKKRIGGRWTSSDSGDAAMFKGSIDEFGIWTKALQSDEVTQLYNSGSGLSYPFTTSSGPTHLKKFNGIAAANIKKINGIAIANIKKINGVAKELFNSYYDPEKKIYVPKKPMIIVPQFNF